MKLVTLPGGIDTFMSYIENQFVDENMIDGIVMEDELDETRVELVRKMVSRGILRRSEGGFVMNTIERNN